MDAILAEVKRRTQKEEPKKEPSGMTFAPAKKEKKKVRKKKKKAPTPPPPPEEMTVSNPEGHQSCFWQPSFSFQSPAESIICLPAQVLIVLSPPGIPIFAA